MASNYKLNDDSDDSEEDSPEIIKQIFGNDIYNDIKLLKEEKYDEKLKIESGRFGDVYKVKYEGIFYALKEADLNTITKLMDYKEKCQKFMREVKIHKNFKKDHENVVKLYHYWVKPFINTEDIESSNLRLFMRLELCEGTLKEWFETNDIREYQTCLKMFHEIAKGLHFIHKESIIHRDLKPDNILIGFDNNCKIADFGLSAIHVKKFKNPEEYYYSNTRGVGNFGYAAPEIFKTENYNRTVDLYAMGCILMEFFTVFKYKIDQIDAFGVLRSSGLIHNDIFNNTPVINQTKELQLQNSIKDLIMQLTLKNPEDRGTSDQLLNKIDNLMKLLQ